MKLRWTSRIIAALFLLLLVLEHTAQAKEAEEEEKEEEEEEEEDGDDKFLYNNDDALPVVEYNPEDEQRASRPDFIFGPDNGPRVVEFYAPWCPHVSISKQVVHF
jgi:hypothetical protein